MAITYSQLTVQPFIPDKMVNVIDLEVIKQLGIMHQFIDGYGGEKRYHFYVNDSSMSASPMFSTDDPQLYLNTIRKVYPDKARRPEWVEKLEAGLEQEIRDQQDPGDLAVVSGLFHSDEPIVEVFQSLLAKQAAFIERGEAEFAAGGIPFIEIEGVYDYAGQLPGSFGGFAYRIYPDRMVRVDTASVIDRLEAIARMMMAVDESTGDSQEVALHLLKEKVNEAIPGFFAS